jgi:hypothetical protein
MTFTTRFQGNEHDRSGTASFSVGTIERDVRFEDSADYHSVAQLLNEAYKLGQQASVREFLSRVQQWSEEKAE